MSLNETQAAAVSQRGSHLLVLAGAGTGKTRVITHRIASLVQDGVTPSSILAVTFTNKAAKEMKARLQKMGVSCGRDDGPWIGTFHATGLRVLKLHAVDLGYAKNFTIYDEDSSESIIKAILADVRGGDRLTPPMVRSWISAAKDAGRGPTDLDGQGIHDRFKDIVAEVFVKYNKELRRSNAMDFADLLGNTVQLLRMGESGPAGWLIKKFRQVLVDEFQDTNRLQMQMVDLISARSELCVVGDDDQCLAKGTMITMGDGSKKPIESVVVGDEVLSCYGSGEFRAAKVWDTSVILHQGYMVEVTTKGGRTLLCTPEHTWFAGFRIGTSPQMHVTYLMHKKGVGWRVGTSRIHTQNADFMMGFAHRAVQEHADALWILSTHASEPEARHDEQVFSLKYGLPMLPFTPRAGSKNGLVHDAELLRRVFAAVDTKAGALRLLKDQGLSPEHPHHRPRSRNSNRRNVVVTLCGDRRGSSPMHRISMVGNDTDGRLKLQEMGFSVRAAKEGSKSWRVESCYTEFAKINEILEQLRGHFDINVILMARLGTNAIETTERNSLPFIPADSVMPGMAVFAEDGSYDVVDHVCGVSKIEEVYDLNVGTTHNFIANGIVTHNSIYGWRGADPGGMMRFSQRPGVKLVKLEANYRSTPQILDCANAVIAKNLDRLGKTLRSSRDGGIQVRVSRLLDEKEEAEHVASKIAGPKFGDHAVLYRTHAQSRVIEEALRRRGIPYTIVGGLRFYDRSEIKDLLSYYRLAVNPKSDVDLIRIINRPARGLGAKAVGVLKTAASKANSSMHEAIARSTDPKLSRMRTILDRLTEGTTLPLREFHQVVLKATWYRDALADTAKLSGSGAQREMAAAKLENVDEMASDVEAYSQEHPSATVATYLEHVALVSSFDRETGPSVSLMTVHAAKGLEFPRVFMVGAEEGLLPHANSLQTFEKTRDPGPIEEERRLAYVAITRAMDVLDITLTHRRTKGGQSEASTPSRFLKDLPRSRIALMGMDPAWWTTR